MSRERVASALHGSLEWDDQSHVRNIDWVTALAYNKRLGVNLERLRNSNDARAMKTTIIMLAIRLPKRLAQSHRMKVAQQALTEWLFPFCPSCLGTKEHTTSSGLVVVCGVCGGSGVRRWSNNDRRGAVGAHDPSHFDKVHQVISNAYYSVGRGISERME